MRKNSVAKMASAKSEEKIFQEVSIVDINQSDLLHRSSVSIFAAQEHNPDPKLVIRRRVLEATSSSVHSRTELYKAREEEALAELEQARAKLARLRLERDDVDEIEYIVLVSNKTSRDQDSQTKRHIWKNEEKMQELIRTILASAQPQQQSTEKHGETEIKDLINWARDFIDTELFVRTNTYTSIMELPAFDGIKDNDWMNYRVKYEILKDFYTKEENLTRLKKTLHGIAWKQVNSIPKLEMNSEIVIDRLENYFGTPNAYLLAEMEILSQLEPHCSLKDLYKYTSHISKIVEVARVFKLSHYLYNSEYVSIIINKLPSAQQSAWKSFKAVREEEESDFEILEAFMKKRISLSVDSEIANYLEAMPCFKGFASLNITHNVTAYVLQFVDFCKREKTKKKHKAKKAKALKKKYNFIPTNTRYIEEAKTIWVKNVQKENFAEEINLISSGEPLPLSSRLGFFLLTIDEQGILRLKSPEPSSPDKKEPAVLDGNHWYTCLYVEQVHRDLNHSMCPDSIKNAVRKERFIIDLDSTVAKVLERCLYCRRKQQLTSLTAN